MLRQWILALVLGLSAASLTVAQTVPAIAPGAASKPARITNADHHFSYEVPTKYQVMTAKDLEPYNAGGGSKFVAGVRPEEGVIPFCIFQLLERPAGMDKPDVENFRKGLASAGAEILDVKYDAARQAYVARLRMDSAAGKLQVLSVTFVGKKELIGLHCYAMDEGFARNQATFDKLIASFEFDKDAAPATQKD